MDFTCYNWLTIPLAIIYTYIEYVPRLFGGDTQSRSWLRHYATNRKAAGSSSDEMDLFNWPNPSSRTVALGST
jgi:hypothetical protein